MRKLVLSLTVILALFSCNEPKNCSGIQVDRGDLKLSLLNQDSVDILNDYILNPKVYRKYECGCIIEIVPEEGGAQNNAYEICEFDNSSLFYFVLRLYGGTTHFHNDTAFVPSPQIFNSTPITTYIQWNDSDTDTIVAKSISVRYDKNNPDTHNIGGCELITIDSIWYNGKPIKYGYLDNKNNEYVIIK